MNSDFHIPIHCTQIEVLRLAYDVVSNYSIVMSAPNREPRELSQEERALYNNAVTYLRNTFATLHHQIPNPETGD